MFGLVGWDCDRFVLLWGGCVLIGANLLVCWCGCSCRFGFCLLDGGEWGWGWLLFFFGVVWMWILGVRLLGCLSWLCY